MRSPVLRQRQGMNREGPREGVNVHGFLSVCESRRRGLSPERQARAQPSAKMTQRQTAGGALLPPATRRWGLRAGLLGGTDTHVSVRKNEDWGVLAEPYHAPSEVRPRRS